MKEHPDIVKFCHFSAYVRTRSAGILRGLTPWHTDFGTKSSVLHLVRGVQAPGTHVRSDYSQTRHIGGRPSSHKANLIPQSKRQDTIAMMIPCLCFLRMALTYIVPVRYCMNRGSANGAPAGGAFLVDIPTEAVAEVRGPDELRLLIFPQPLDGALKNQNAAPASPPCFRRRRWSAPLLFESCTVLL